MQHRHLEQPQQFRLRLVAGKLQLVEVGGDARDEPEDPNEEEDPCHSQGTSTGIDVSGTAEEINRAVSLGKPVHVYFSEEPLPRDTDPGQLAALKEFKDELQVSGLLGQYRDPADLAGQVVRAVEADVAEENWAPASVDEQVTPAPQAALSWKHVHRKEQRGLDKRGRMQYRTLANDLVVRNGDGGTVPAENLTFEVKAVGDTQFAFPEPPEGPVTVHPDSTMSWPLIPMPSMGAGGRTVRVIAQWEERGQPRERTWTISLNTE